MNNQAVTFLNSCENVAILVANAVDAQKYFSITIYFFLLSLFVKLFLSIYKTTSQKNLWMNIKVSRLPKKIEKIILRNHFDPSNFILINSNKLIACTIGFLSPKIVFSKKMIDNLSVKEIEAVFAHELHHYKKNHNFFLIISHIITSTFFFFPAFQVLNNYLRLRFEIEADRFALNQQKTNYYLINALSKTLDPKASYLFTTFSAINSDLLQKRVIHLNNTSQKQSFFCKSSLNKIFISVIMLLSIFIGSHSIKAITKTFANDYYASDLSCNFSECFRDCISNEMMSKNVPQSKQRYQSYQ